jgi:dethiobiotin synthetase
VRGVLVTGTDTGAGKTVLCAAIAAGLRARGVEVHASKPVLTGTDEAPDPAGGAPPDHELLAAVTGQRPEAVAPLRFGPAVSPHLAAELAGRRLTTVELLGAVRSAAEGGAAVVVEGVGGLLVPLAPGLSVRDLAVALGLPVVVAARPGLGTIGHTLLTLEAARTAGLDVRAVVLTPWPVEPGAIERSNRATIAAEGDVPVAVLPEVELASAALAAAGARLPVDAWLGPGRAEAG